MNPLFLVAAAAILSGNRRRRRPAAEKKEEGVGAQRPRPLRRPVRKGATPKGTWTSFPWDPDQVSAVAEELLFKGEHDPDNLTLAIAKTLYPVHPISGDAFEWPAAEGPEADMGARMIFTRIRLRVNTLVASFEERVADEATEAVVAEAAATDEAPVPQAPTLVHDAGGPDDDEPGDDEDEESPEEEDAPAASPRIGRMSVSPMPTPVAPTPVRRALTLRNRSRVMVRKDPPFDPSPFLPEGNRPSAGVMHTVERGESMADIAKGALIGSGVAEPTAEQVAHFVSLVVTSPYNGDLRVCWDEEHNVPGSQPFPWGTDTPQLWLPAINEDRLAEGTVTTHGVTWSDGSSGITPPPELEAHLADG